MPYADDLRGFSEPPSGSYFPALAAMSGMQQAPPLAQFEGGDHLRQGMPPQRVRGPIETIKGAFTPRQDEQGNPKADSLGSILSAALMSMPGTGRPVGMIPKGPKFQANQYVEPPVAANAVPAHEVTRLQKQLGRMLPITAENEAEAMAIRAQIRKLDEVHDAAYWGRDNDAAVWGRNDPPRPQKPNPLTTDLDELYGAPSPQEKARLLGIKVVDPMKRDVIERGRSGRPNRTEPLGIGNEDRIIDAAMNWKPKPAAPVAAEKGAGSGGGSAVTQRVLDAYKELGGGGDSVRLHKLRERLSDVPRAELDKTLLDMQKSGKANLMHLDNPRDIKAVGDAALKGPSDNYHALWLEGPSAGGAKPTAAPAPSAPKPVAPAAKSHSDWLNGLLK